jgi:hypothetical protein
MAFTIAHMAAALPFYRSRKWLNFEALLIGTMLPDLPYFLNSDRAVWQQSHAGINVEVNNKHVATVDCKEETVVSNMFDIGIPIE